MIKFISGLRFEIFIVLLLALPAFAFLLRPGEYWNMHDDMQMVRQLQMEKCFQDGQFPCRWTPDLGYGYGYPLFNYYPPFPYLLGQVFRLFGLQFMTVVKLVASLQFILAAIFMYLFARPFLGRYGSWLAAVLYTYAPYHSVNIYVRAAMNEAWASVFFPLIFYLIYQFVTTLNRRYLLGLSLSIALLLLSHNPMALIFLPLSCLWILFLVRLDLRRLIPLGLSYIFAVGLSAFFTLPVVFESHLVQIESMFINYYHFTLHFISLFQIFLSNFWGDGPSLWGTGDGMSFALGYPLWILSLLTAAIIAWRYLVHKTRPDNFWVFVFFLAAGFGFLFLTHERSTFIWLQLSFLQKIQFPWRILNISVFLFSFAAASIFLLIPRQFQLRLFVSLFSLTLALSWHQLTPVTHGPITDSQKFQGQAWVNQVTGGIYDYLPKTAPTAPKQPAAEFIESVDPSQDYTLTGAKKGTDWLFLNLYLPREATVVLPVLYFPDFRLLDFNQTVPVRPDPQLGRISFSLPAGNHQLYLKLHNTPIRTAANIISLISWLMVLPLWKLWKSKP